MYLCDVCLVECVWFVLSSAMCFVWDVFRLLCLVIAMICVGEYSVYSALCYVLKCICVVATCVVVHYCVVSSCM